MAPAMLNSVIAFHCLVSSQMGTSIACKPASLGSPHTEISTCYGKDIQTLTVTVEAHRKDAIIILQLTQRSVPNGLLSMLGMRCLHHLAHDACQRTGAMSRCGQGQCCCSENYCPVTVPLTVHDMPYADMLLRVLLGKATR